MKTAETYVQWLRDFDPRTLQTRRSRLAFWINTYNMLTIHAVQKKLEEDPDFTQKDHKNIFQRIKFFWSTKHVIGGKQFSLYQIENNILRKMNEPRIHFALNCASASCPVLKEGLYNEESLERELEAAASGFIQSPLGVVIEKGNMTVRLSRIFKWYKKDFKGAAGSVLAYVKEYLQEGDRAFIDSTMSNISIRYMEYNWALHTSH
jgi:hypothetical protein